MCRFLCLGSSFEDHLLRYKNGIKLTGIIYLQRITDNRIVSTPCQRNLRMLEELCGDQALKKVVLVTTIWDKVQPDTGVRREKELFESLWKMMIDHGALTARFTNSADSAWNIIDSILKCQETDVLPLQEELVDLERALSETQAGKTLFSDLKRLLAEERTTIQSLTEQARGQPESNPQLTQKLKAELEHIEKDLDKIANEVKTLKRLKIPIGKRLLLLFSKRSWAVRIPIGLFSFHTH